MASAVLLLPFYIQYLSAQVYGALALYLAVSLFVQILVTYSFDTSAYIHYHEYKNDTGKLSSFISSAFIFMLLIGAGVGIVLTVLGELLVDLIFHDSGISFYPFGLMAVTTGIFQAVFKVYSTILQSREKPVLYLRLNLLLFMLIAGFTVAGLYAYPESLVGPVGGRLLAGLIVAGWVLNKTFGEFGFHFNYPLLKSTFGFNHYAFIYQVQQWVVNYADRFLMLFFLPLASVGVYDFAVKCLLVIELVMNGLHTSFYPKVVSTVMSQSEKTSTVEINRYYHGLTAVVMVLVSLGIFVLPFLVNLLNTTRGYQEVVQYFPYLAVLYLVRCLRLFFSSPYGILKFTKPLPGIYAAVAVIKIVFILLLIKPFGIYGLVAAALVSLVIEIILLRVVINKKFSFRFNANKMILTPMLLLAMVLILEPTAAKQYVWQVHILYVVVAGASLLWVYRNELKALLFSKILKT